MQSHVVAWAVVGRRKGSLGWWLVPLGCHIATQLLVLL